MPIREINPQSIPNNSGNSSSKSLVPTAKQSKEEIFIPETPKYTFEDLVLPISRKGKLLQRQKDSCQPGSIDGRMSDCNRDVALL